MLLQFYFTINNIIIVICTLELAKYHCIGHAIIFNSNNNINNLHLYCTEVVLHNVVNRNIMLKIVKL